jgi:hypothetical protein
MFRNSPRRWAAVVLGLLLALPSVATSAPIEFTAFGAAPGDIQGTVDTFRAALGDPNNGNAPGVLDGRREINWDGGGAVTPSPAPTPFTGFQNSRGATFTTDGTGFLQAAPVDLAATFGQPGYETDFQTFSPLRLFTPVGSNITDAFFSVPGSGGSIPAVVSGFGAVFTDVDFDNTTSIQFFDVADVLLATIFAPPSNNGLSFAGVLFDAGEGIARVRITTGNAALGVPDGDVDVVAMDDFLYSEPDAVPEPATILLTAFGLLAGGGRAFRRGTKR